jgi:phenylacetate-CoA ligase
MYWNEKIETMKSDEMRDLQLQSLKKIVRYAYKNVPLYQEKFKKIRLKPEDIKTLEDIRYIPFTTKEDMRKTYPFGLFATKMKNIVRIHGSSGTTGKPTVVGYTKKDLANWQEAMSRLIMAAGGREEDIAQVCFGYGMFTGGFGLHAGLENIGITVIPASSGNSERHLMYMQDYGTNIMVSTPSYALYLAEIADEVGVDIKKLSLRLGLFGGEGHTIEMRNEIEKRWNIKATENYGLSEIIGPGVSGECYEQSGMHINEDMFYPEIINPNDGKVLDDGEKGELVLTTLSKQGVPMLRYRTKDITYLMRDKCKCGRTTVRMNKVDGRTDDMLIIRGVNVFPSQIESVLLTIDYISPQYQIIIRKKGYMDDIEVLVELIDRKSLDSFKELEKIEKHIRHKLRNVLQIDVKVKLVEHKTIERSVGKAKRLVDLRKQ